MVTCDFVASLAAYYDGRLSGEQLDRVREHIASCASCTHELRALSELSRTLAATPIPTASADFVQRLQSTAAARWDALRVEHSNQSLFRFVTRLTGLAAAIVVFAAGWLLLHRAAPTAPAALASWEQQVLHDELADSDLRADTQFDVFVVDDLAGERQ
jgi:anti-sigma factor RsiW